MSVMRSALLAGSQSVWLRERAMRWGFVRRSVSRFMPGERLEDAVEASRALIGQRIPTIITHLGENLTDLSEAKGVTEHYMDALAKIHAAKLDIQVSVKLTQLGLDQSVDHAVENTVKLAKRSEELGNFCWIDMESSPYVDRTLDVYRRTRAVTQAVGVCLQAYLRRTPKDLETLIPLGPSIRLVKGAYAEPADVAFPDKKDVDEAFFTLASRMLEDSARATGTRVGIATHDASLVGRLKKVIADRQAPPASYEFEMLYGIQRGLQSQLVSETQPIRVLISYGEYWFPWYMRRLAERPANVGFVLKNMVGGG
jgi:proline dehydrogenase